MKEFDLNFFEAWDELEVLTEASEADNTNNLNYVRELILKNLPELDIDSLDEKSEWSEIAKNARKASGRLARSKNWVPTLQFLLNGTKVERDAVDNLSDSDFRNALVNAISATFDELKLKTKKILANKYTINNDGTHDAIDPGTKIVSPDIVVSNESNEEKNNNDIINTAEIKATINSPNNASGFHDADLVLIYLIDSHDWYCRLKYDSDKYTPPKRFFNKTVNELVSLWPSTIKATAYGVEPSMHETENAVEADIINIENNEN